MPRRVEDYRGLTHMSRLRLLHAVQRLPGRRLPELADEAGLHINTARDHLRVLEDEGLIVSYTLTTGSRGRPPVVFHPVEEAESSPAASRRAADAQKRGEILRRLSPDLDHTDDLGEEASHQIDTLYEHLEDAGLEPALDESQLTIELTPCLYFPAMTEERPLVCSVHARLVQQELKQVHGPVELRRLEPFVTEDRCVIALGIQGEETRAERQHDRLSVDPAVTDEEIMDQASASYTAKKNPEDDLPSRD